MPRSRRAWPVATYRQRIARILDVACVLYAPPVLVALLAEHLHIAL